MTKYGARKNVLHNFMSISEEDIQLAKAACTTQDNSATINMYVTLWSKFDKRKYMGSAESVIYDQLQQLNGLLAKFKGFQYNIALFCNYAVNCVKTLESARGKDNQAPIFFVKALNLTAIFAYIVWHAMLIVHHLTSTQL
eukprot:15343851-Ditylum_brightwellii.AAC.2